VFDETNKTEGQDFELPEKLFESDESESEGFAGQTDESTADHSGEETNGDTIKIKYNGEERDITLDEARILAQKGMNYDHVVSERDTKYLRELNFLDKVAAERGMTRAQYMQSVENSAGSGEEGRNAPSPAEIARQHVRQISDSLGLTGPWGNLFNRYPSLGRKEAFSELSEAVKDGMTPLEAYQAKLLGERDRELAIARNNSMAAMKTIGSLDGESGGGDRDEFLEGFFADE